MDTIKTLEELEVIEKVFSGQPPDFLTNRLTATIREAWAEREKWKLNWADTVHAIAVKGLGLTDPYTCESNTLPPDWGPKDGLLSDQVLALRSERDALQKTNAALSWRGKA